MPQLVTRVDDTLVAAVDGLVADGVVASRSDAVRRGLERLVEDRVRATTGERIVDAYRRAPQTDAELGWSDEATARMIADEPW